MDFFFPIVPLISAVRTRALPCNAEVHPLIGAGEGGRGSFAYFLQSSGMTLGDPMYFFSFVNRRETNLGECSLNLIIGY